MISAPHWFFYQRWVRQYEMLSEGYRARQNLLKMLGYLREFGYQEKTESPLRALRGGLTGWHDCCAAIMWCTLLRRKVRALAKSIYNPCRNHGKTYGLNALSWWPGVLWSSIFVWTLIYTNDVIFCLGGHILPLGILYIASGYSQKVQEPPQRAFLIAANRNKVCRAGGLWETYNTRRYGPHIFQTSPPNQQQ